MVGTCPAVSNTNPYPLPPVIAIASALIIDDPGSFSGMAISPMPQRGPEASQRTFIGILSKVKCPMGGILTDVL